MKSLKIKKVILKNPHLRRLRKNLRIVLRLAIQDKIRRLGKLEDLYLEKSKLRKLTPSQKKRQSQIIQLGDRLMRLERKSCITCNENFCVFHKDRPGKSTWFEHRSTDLDLVWIPWREKWVCLDCYEEYYKNATLDGYIKSEMMASAEFLMGFDDDKLYKLVRKDDPQKFKMIRGNKLVKMIEKDIREKFKDSFVNK